ncbi:GDSL-type esterase/lipase family protein [Paenibacillus sp. LHD-38]|uniref:GDSL-type esterase/lipase family protein n=1 Tax=Paenibacillus sp. LHD-38 TaxID=3072143 RepID=UPI002810804A|nr:GDSL-type esterase/lipase family protein [Paenibacillus sp. LHD-38]MDQ8735158.1 GDSL-type esterase/lipase family protein [Paenibacillus sp. LHD-38]
MHRVCRKGITFVMLFCLITASFGLNNVSTEAASSEGIILDYSINRAFNGSSDFVDKTGDVSKIAALSQGSVAVKFKSTSTALAKTFLSASDTTKPSSNISFTMNNGTVYVENRENNQYATKINATGTYNDGKWHTAIYSVDQSGTKIYVDGVERGSSTSTAFFPHISSITGMWVGKNVDSTGSEWFYSGEIDFVKIYNRTLTIEERNELSSVSTIQLGYTNPFIDLAAETGRQILTDREAGVYLGHPDSVLLNDGKTIYTTYPKGHGTGPILLKKSTDGGLTWSERLPTPPSWAESKETPTLYKLEKPDGTTRLELISGLPRDSGGFKTAYSEDEGQTWTELTHYFAGQQRFGWVAMASLTRLKKADGSWDFKWMGIFHDGSYNNWKTYMTFDEQGNEQWSFPERLLAEHDAIEKFAGLCEIEVIRSPDGRQLALLARAQHKKTNAMVAFSNDEGNTWTATREMQGALMGERHKAEYDPVSGRLLITFREINRRSAADLNDWVAGDWVAWVGTYDDLVGSKEGQYRVRLMEDFTPSVKSGDTGYAGNVVLADGTFVLTSYGYFDPQDTRAAYIMTVRLKLSELDKAVGTVPLEDYKKLKVLLNENRSSKWVFVGDSDTQGNKYTNGLRSFVDYFQERVRWELRHFNDFVINAGSRDNKASEIVHSFNENVARFNPAVVAVMLGVKDADAGAAGQEAFKQNVIAIVDQIRAIQAIPVLQTPNTIKAGSSKTDLDNYAAIIREVAEQKKVVLIDHYEHWSNRQVDQQGRSEDWLQDGIHPNQLGHYEIAKKIFKDLAIFDASSLTGKLVLPYRFGGEAQNEDKAEDFLTEAPASGLADYSKLKGLLSEKLASTWLFTGDSITHGPLHTNGLSNFVEYFQERVRSELGHDSDLVINTGISGNRTGDLLTGFEQRVTKFNPDAVAVMLGMNDVGVGLAGRETFKNNLRSIVDRIRAIDAVPILQTPNPANGDASRADLVNYVDIIRQVAVEKDSVLIDHYAYWEKQSATRWKSWLNDLIHPNEYGHLEMAKKIFADLDIFDANSLTSKLQLTYSAGTRSIENDRRGTGSELEQFEFVGAGWGHGSDSYSNRSDDYYQLKFVGTRIKLMGAKDPKHGIAAISIDGGTEVEVDLYAAVRNNQFFYTSPELPYGEHTVKVRVTGNKNMAASDRFVAIDQAVILERQIVQNDLEGTGLGQIEYEGNWSIGEASQSSTSGHYFKMRSSDKQVVLIGTKGPDQGIAAISIDDGPEQWIDLYAPARIEQVEYFVSPFLAKGQHTIKVRVTGEKNASAASSNVSLDRIEVVPSQVAPTKDSAVLIGPEEVKSGDTFAIQMGLSHLTTTAYAQDIKIDYDATAMAFVSAKSLINGVQLINAQSNTPGKIRLILASEGEENAINGNAQIVELSFQAKALSSTVTGIIEAAEVVLADENGLETYVEPASIHVKVISNIPEVSGDLNNDGKYSVGDLAIVAVHYGKDAASPDWEQSKKADLNKDGKIDLMDLSAIARKIVE